MYLVRSDNKICNGTSLLLLSIIETHSINLCLEYYPDEPEQPLYDDVQEKEEPEQAMYDDLEGAMEEAPKEAIYDDATAVETEEVCWCGTGADRALCILQGWLVHLHGEPLCWLHAVRYVCGVCMCGKVFGENRCVHVFVVPLIDV